MKRLIREVHRRSLWQVLGIYLIGSWMGFEVIQALTEGLQLPNWFPALALVLFIIGLPLVLATAFVQERATGPEASDPTLLPIQAPEEGGGERAGERDGLRRVLTWRNALRAGVAAFALWGVATAAWVLWRPAGGERRAKPVELSATAVAVLPFTFRGNEQFAYLGEGMVDLLSKALDGAGELRSVDPYALLSYVDQRDARRLDPQRGRSLAGHFGAGLFVLGNIIEAGGRLRVDAALYDARGGQRLDVEATATDESGVFQLVDELARQLTAGVSGGSDSRLTQIAAATTTSIEALKAYLEGEREFRGGHYARAVAAYRRATAADSSFALAWYRMSLAAEWRGLSEVVFDAARQAVRHSERLQEHDRRLLEASLALRRGAGAEAERLYRDIVAAYPEDVEAWYQLGEALFHYAPVRGIGLSESRPAFQRVLDLDPKHVFALFHLARIEAMEGNAARLDSIVDRVQELQPESERVLELLALRALVMADSVGLDSVKAALQRAPEIVFNAVNVSGYARDLDSSGELALLLTAPSQPRAIRAAGYFMAAYAEIGQGRWDAAAAVIPQAEALNPVLALDFEARTAAAPYSPLPRSRIEELRTRLTGLATPDLGLDLLGLERGMPAFYRDYLLGLLSARLGDLEAATRYAGQVARSESLPEWGSLVDDCAWIIRASVAWADGRAADALAALENVKQEAWYGLLVGTPIGALTPARFLRAEALAAVGRQEEALRWYRAVEELAHPTDVLYWGPAYLRQAEIYEELGDREAAATYYRRLIDLWGDCDPELRPRVLQARQALARLTAQQARSPEEEEKGASPASDSGNSPRLAGPLAT